MMTSRQDVSMIDILTGRYKWVSSGLSQRLDSTLEQSSPL